MATKTTREIVTAILQEKYSKKDAINLEKLTHTYCVNFHKNVCNDETIDDVYEKHAYEKLGELMVFPEKKDEIVKDLVGNKHLWDSCVYEETRQKQSQDVVDQVSAPKVIEGSFQCKNFKCKSFQCTWDNSQTKSADEGFTTTVTCSKCGYRYSFS